MGVNEKNIFNIGSLAVENLKSIEEGFKSNIFKKFGLSNEKKFCILNYHPPSLDTKIKFQDQIKNIFEALKDFDIQILITSPGLDSGRNNVIKDYRQIKKKE